MPYGIAEREQAVAGDESDDAVGAPDRAVDLAHRGVVRLEGERAPFAAAASAPAKTFRITSTSHPE